MPSLHLPQVKFHISIIFLFTYWRLRRNDGVAMPTSCDIIIPISFNAKIINVRQRHNVLLPLLIVYLLQKCIPLLLLLIHNEDANYEWQEHHVIVTKKYCLVQVKKGRLMPSISHLTWFSLILMTGTFYCLLVLLLFQSKKALTRFVLIAELQRMKVFNKLS